MAQQKFSAGDRAAQMIPVEVDIDGNIYKVRRTGKAMKEIVRLAENDEEADDPIRNIDLLYEGLSFLFVDTEGNHPSSEQLEETLDFEVAQELMGKFLPGARAEGNDSTNPSTPASPGQT